MSSLATMLMASAAIILMAVAASFVANSALLGVQVYERQIENLKALSQPKPRLQVVDAVYSHGSSTLVRLNVTNTGDGGVRLRDVLRSDIIVTYGDAPHRRAVLLRYDDLLSPDTWRISGVYVGGRAGDLVNPINLNLKTGIWDPGETLELELHLSEEVDGGLGVVLALPSGAVTTAEL